MADKKKAAMSAEARAVLDLMGELVGRLKEMWLLRGKGEEALYCAAYTKAQIDALINQICLEVSDGE
ncbi:hypothetical protein A2V82_16370 [candidate division KSB1 bacterium RBG_16_48_16]|nr:MAG: hypothetical protein A2V82_16370 [candidate division KSB1 bacterium RBG_16_48_16]